MIALVKTLLKIRVTSFKKWFKFNLLLLVLLAYFAYMEVTGELIPFTSIFTDRNYSPDRIINIGPSINKSFTNNEFVTGVQCMVFVVVVPPLVMLFTHYDDYEMDHDLDTSLSTVSAKECYNVFNVINAYSLMVLVNGVVTNVLKIAISNPRPDFLSRCNLQLDYSGISKIQLSQCQTPLDDHLIVDGLRSTPSGHSSFIACAMIVLFNYLHSGFSSAKMTLSKTFKLNFWCIIVMFVVMVSRIVDHRHHVMDTVSGMCIGWAVGYFGLKHFPKKFEIYRLKYKQLPL